MIRISDNKIIWDKYNELETEEETINLIRDEAEKIFFTDIKKGKTFLFKEWNMERKEIIFSLV